MNSQIMETYEKKVQKARASVESFYISMSKGATKGILGGLQESISLVAQLGEKITSFRSICSSRGNGKYNWIYI